MAFGYQTVDYDPFAEDEEEEKEQQQTGSLAPVKPAAPLAPPKYAYQPIDYDPFKEEPAPGAPTPKREPLVEDLRAAREKQLPAAPAGEEVPGAEILEPTPIPDEYEPPPMPESVFDPRGINPRTGVNYTPEEWREKSYRDEAELKQFREERGLAPDFSPEDYQTLIRRENQENLKNWWKATRASFSRWWDDLDAEFATSPKKLREHAKTLHYSAQRSKELETIRERMIAEGKLAPDPDVDMEAGGNVGGAQLGAKGLPIERRAIDPETGERVERDLTGAENKGFANQFVGRLPGAGYEGVKGLEQAVWNTNFLLSVQFNSNQRKTIDSVLDQMAKKAHPGDTQKQEAYKVRAGQEISDYWEMGIPATKFITDQQAKLGLTLKEDPNTVALMFSPPENLDQAAKKNAKRIAQVEKDIDEFYKNHPEWQVPADYFQLTDEEREVKYPGVYWGDNLGQNMINSVASIGTYMGTAALTKNHAAAAFLSGAVLFPQFVQEIYQELERVEKEEGIVIPMELKAELALWRSVPSAMVEGLSERLGFGPALTKKFGKHFTKKALVKNVVESIKKNAAANKAWKWAGRPATWTTKQALAGGVEEGTQQIIANSAAQVAGSERSLFDGVPRAFKVGAVIEPGLGAGPRIIQYGFEAAAERRGEAARKQAEDLLKDTPDQTAEDILMEPDRAAEAATEAAAERVPPAEVPPGAPREFAGAEGLEAEEAAAEFTPEQLAEMAAAAPPPAEAKPAPKAPMKPTERARMGERPTAAIKRIWGMREIPGGPRVAPVRTTTGYEALPVTERPTKRRPAELERVKEIWAGKRPPATGGLIEEVSIPPAKTRITPTTRRKVFQNYANEMGKMAGEKVRFDNVIFQNERPVGLQMTVTSGAAKGARFVLSDKMSKTHAQNILHSIINAYTQKAPEAEVFAPKKKAKGADLQQEFDALVADLNDEQRAAVKDLIEWKGMPLDQRLGLMKAELATLEAKKELKRVKPAEVYKKPPKAAAPPKPAPTPPEVPAPAPEIVGPTPEALPIAPPTDRWTADRGAMPGEPSLFLDVQGEDLDTAQAAIIEHQLDDGSLFELVSDTGASMGMFKDVESAVAAAEERIEAPEIEAPAEAPPVLPGGRRVAPVRTVPSEAPAEAAPELVGGPRVAPVRAGVGVAPVEGFVEHGTEGYSYRREGAYNYRVYDPRGNQIGRSFRTEGAAQAYITRREQAEIPGAERPMVGGPRVAPVRRQEMPTVLGEETIETPDYRETAEVEPADMADEFENTGRGGHRITQEAPASEPTLEEVNQEVVEQEVEGARWIEGHLQTPDRFDEWWNSLAKARDTARKVGLTADQVDWTDLDSIVAGVDAFDNTQLTEDEVEQAAEEAQPSPEAIGRAKYRGNWVEITGTTEIKRGKDKGKFWADTVSGKPKRFKVAAEDIQDLERGRLIAPDIDSEIENISDSELDNLLASTGLPAAKEAEDLADSKEPGDKTPTTRAPQTVPAAESVTEKSERHLTEILGDASKAGVEGVGEALTGLYELFGGGSLKSFPGGIDEDTYAKAKPHFEAALEKFRDAKKSLEELVQFLVERFGENIKPYIRQWVNEKKQAKKAGKARRGDFQNVGYVWDPEELAKGIAGKTPKSAIRIIADKMAPAKLWNIELPEGATPGLPRVMKATAKQVNTFKEFVERKVGLHQWSYRRIKKWETRVENWFEDGGGTIEDLQALAADYGKYMEKVVNAFSGKTTIMDGISGLQQIYLDNVEMTEGAWPEYYNARENLDPELFDRDYIKNPGAWYLYLTEYWERFLANENDILLSEVDPHNRTKNKEVIRTGLPDYLEGRELLKSEELQEPFNFNGVGYGTIGWINQDERKRVVHAAYNAFKDLAATLGIPDQAMGLNGELAIQFANLGHKARGAAAAYFPGEKTINFTRDNGDGTMSHEWGHGFDYLVGDMNELVKIHQKSLIESFYFIYDWDAGVRLADDIMHPDSDFMKRTFDVKKQPRLDYIKDEIRRRYEDAVRKETDYYSTAKQMDPGYTDRMTEMWARALEAYVYDNLGGTNNYLVNDFVEAGRVGGVGKVGASLVYPAGREREEFNERMALFWENIEWDENGMPSMKEGFEGFEALNEARLQTELQLLLDQVEERYKALWASEPSPDGNYWYRYDATALGPLMQPDGYIGYDKEFKQEDQGGQGAVAYLQMLHPDDIIGFKLTNIIYEGEGTYISPDGGFNVETGEFGEETLEEGTTRPDRGPREGGEIQPGGERGGEEGEGAGGRPGTERDQDRGGQRDSDEGVHTLNPGNYRIEDESLNEALPINDRFNANLAALRVLNQLETEDRRAKKHEKDILAGFSGWGGMSEMFAYDASDAWAARKELIQAELTREEIADAEASSVSSYYTPVPVARFMWKLAQRLGLENGNVLDPAFGANGVFTGTIPKDLAEALSIHGVEKDAISTRIARRLYELANIEHQGFEDSKKPLNRYNLTITNVPFANYTPTDKRHNKEGYKLHNYYINKMLDLTSRGGVNMVITTSRTMDSGGEHLKKFAEKADFVGGIRLPADIYSATGVTTDILVFRKKIEGSDFEGIPLDDWTTTTTEADTGLDINTYFTKYPDQIVGTLEKVTGRYGDEQIRVVKDFEDLGLELSKRGQAFPENIMELEVAKGELSVDDLISAPGTIKEGGIYLNDAGQVAEKVDGQEVLWPNKTAAEKKAVNIGKGFIEILDQVRTVLRAQKMDAPEAEVKAAQADLKKAYDKFKKKFGPVNEAKNVSIYAYLTDAPWVTALEEYDPDTGKVTKLADIFTKKIVGTEQRPDFAETDHDALNMALDEFGYPNIDYMAKLRGTSPDAVLKGILDRVVENPETGILETLDEYLAGNVRRKLAVAKEMAKSNPEYERNVKLLEAAQPDDIPPHRITARIGAPWIRPSHLTAFVKEKLNMRGDLTPTFHFNPITYEWSFTFKGRERWRGEVKAETQRAIRRYSESVEATSVWGTPRMNFFKLIDNAIQGKRPVVTYRTAEGDIVTDPVATAGAEAKLVEIQNEFNRWLFAETERADEAVNRFNEIVNTSTTSQYDGSHLTFPGKSMAVLTKKEAEALGTTDKLTFYDHQVNAVWQYLRNGNLYLAHEVGAGKTMTMAMIAMEAKRLKGKKKVLYVTLNDSTMGQAIEEIKRLYPLANIMPIKVSTKKQRQRKDLNKMAVNDFDIAIMRQQDLDRIDLSPEADRVFIDQDLQELRAALEEAKAGGKRILEQDIQRRILEEEAKLKEAGAYAEAKEEQRIYFDDLGVDLMIVDEAHQYKNIPYITQLDRITGLNPSGSKVAQAFFRKTQYLNAQFPKQDGLVLASGTPLTNSIAEFFNLQRVLQPKESKRQGNWRFDRWIANYGDVGSQLEWDGARQQFKEVTTNKRIINAGRLLATAFQNIDTVRAEDTDIVRPKIYGGKPIGVEIPRNKYVEDYNEIISERAKAVEDDPRHAMYEGRPDNMLRIISDMSNVAIDQRLQTSQVYDEKTQKWKVVPGPYANTKLQKDSKIYKASRNIYDRWKEEKKNKGVQLVFADRGIPGKYTKKFKYLEDEALAKLSSEKQDQYQKDLMEYEASAGLEFNTYDALKDELVKLGIPRDQIAYIHDADHSNKVKKAANLRKLYKKVNSGEIRVLLGSTTKAGTGVNVQERVSDVHHLDVWWNYSAWEQRNGRAIRAGNTYKEVRIWNYIAENTVDATRWSKIFAKGKVLHTALAGDINVDVIEDISEEVISAKEMEAIGAANPLLARQADLITKVRTLTLERSSHLDTVRDARGQLANMPNQISALENTIEKAEQSLEIMEPVTAVRFVGSDETLVFKKHGKEIAAALAEITEREGYADPDKWNKGFQTPIFTLGSHTESEVDQPVLDKKGNPVLDKEGKPKTQKVKKYKFKPVLAQGVMKSYAAPKDQRQRERYLVIKNEFGSYEAYLSEKLAKKPAEIKANVSRAVTTFKTNSETRIKESQARIEELKNKRPALEKVVDTAWPKEQEFEDAQKELTEVEAQMSAGGQGVDPRLGVDIENYKAPVPVLDDFAGKKDWYINSYWIYPSSGDEFTLALDSTKYDHKNYWSEGRTKFKPNEQYYTPEELKPLIDETIDLGPVVDRPKTYTTIDQKDRFWVNDGSNFYTIDPNTWLMADRIVGPLGDWHFQQLGYGHYLVHEYEGTPDAMVAIQPEMEAPKGVRDKATGAGEPATGEPAFAAKRIAPARALSVKEVQLFADAVRVQWVRTGPRFRIHATQEALLRAVPQTAELLRAEKREGDLIAGAYYDNTIHLVAENLGSFEEVTTTILHEGFGHHGLRGVLGRDVFPVLRDLYIAKRKEVNAIGQELGIDMKTQEGQIRAAEEWFAHQAQQQIDSKWMDRLIAAIKKWIRNIIGMRLRISDAEIRALVSAARQFTLTGKRVTAHPGQRVAFAKKQKVGDNIPHEDILRGEVQKRFKAAKGVAGKGPVLQRMKEGIAKARTERQHFPYLQEIEDKGQRHRLADILRLHQEIPEVARNDAAEKIKEWIKDLGTDAYSIFTTNIVLADMKRDIDSGLLNDEMLDEGETLPFGFESTEEVLEALKKFEALARSYPVIQEALAARRKYIDNLVQDMIDYKILKKEVANHKDYYHHQVLKYWGTKDEGKGLMTGSADVRKHWRPWQTARKGSLLDYNTEYVEAEFTALSQQIAQLETARTLERIKKEADIYVELKDDAKRRNLEQFYIEEAKKLSEQTGIPYTDLQIKGNKDLDPLYPYRVNIAMGMSNLEKLAEDGKLEGDSEFDDIIEQLVEQAQMRREDPDLMADVPKGIPDARYWDWLAYLVRTGQPGASWAATIFKNIHARNKHIQDALGKKFLTYRNIMPETHTEWKPEPGKSMFWANTFSDGVIQQVINGDRELTEEDKRQVLAKGRDIVWVLPKGLAKQMDQFKDPPSNYFIGRMSAATLRMWKQYILINPMRVLKYNINNMSGDMDIVIAYNPKILGGMRKSLRDLRAFNKGLTSKEIKAELELARRLGVIGSGWSVQEVDEITKKMGEDRFVRQVIQGEKPNLAMRYWQLAKSATATRENILRLASFRWFRDQIAQGNAVYGASKVEEIDAIQDPDEKAAKLARELVGDYGNISHAGQWIRKRLMPFYSWMEINTPRYVYMMRNIKHEGRDPSLAPLKILGIKGLTKAAFLTTKMMALYGSILLWNNLFFPEEEEKLGKAGRRQLHLILGHRSDGSIISIRFQGALSDTLSFFGLEDWPEDIKEVIRNEKTVLQKLAEVPKAFATRLIHGMRPEPKVFYETLTGSSTYPDPFTPRPIRDTWEHILRMFSLDSVYRRAMGRPGRGKTMAQHFIDDLQRLVLYQSDPGEQMYYDTRKMVYDYLDAQGVERPSGRPNNKGNALYWYRQALKYGDFDAAVRYLKKYYELGGTPRGLKQSMKKAHPLTGINVKDRYKFIKTLDPAQRKTYEDALKWYKQTYLSGDYRQVVYKARKEFLQQQFKEKKKAAGG